MSDFELSFAIPLDADGFLRRECPRCHREFKWRPSEGDTDDAAAIPAEGYACPYCAERAPADHWWTKAQLEYAERLAASEILGPELKKLERRSDPGALISFEVTADVPAAPDPLPEDKDDMRRIEFSCHPAEPIKILEGWGGEVHCLICALPTSADDAS